MIEPLVFMMGEFKAEFPTNLLYAKNHMWALPQGEDHYRFGFSAYAVRLLQDVYFLELQLSEGDSIALRQEFGTIESKKAESGLYAPISGSVVAINPIVLNDPSAINADKYGEGWLLEIQGSGAELLDPMQYRTHLEAAWDVAQRTIKGQANA